MSDNFFLETSKLAGSDRQLLAQWLAQYEAENDLNRFFESAPDIFADEEGSEDLQRLSSAAVPNWTSVAPGQIRMLKASLTSDPEIITSVLVLSQWEGANWLIAPFSRFTVPATPGELSTNADFAAYSVLEVWNATVVPDLLVNSDSVFLRTVPEELRKEACQLYFHLLAEDVLPDSTAEKTGPQILSEIDPRIQYLLNEQEQLRPLQREAERINQLLAQFSAFNQDKDVFAERFAVSFDVCPALLAAGEEEKTVFHSVEGSEAVVRCLVREGQARIKVFAPDRMDYSHDLDGWFLMRPDGKVLGRIADAGCIIPDFDGQATLAAAPDGSLHELQPLKE